MNNITKSHECFYQRLELSDEHPEEVLGDSTRERKNLESFLRSYKVGVMGHSTDSVGNPWNLHSGGTGNQEQQSRTKHPARKRIRLVRKFMKEQPEARDDILVDRRRKQGSFKLEWWNKKSTGKETFDCVFIYLNEKSESSWKLLCSMSEKMTQKMPRYTISHQQRYTTK